MVRFFINISLGTYRFIGYRLWDPPKKQTNKNNNKKTNKNTNPTTTTHQQPQNNKQTTNTLLNPNFDERVQCVLISSQWSVVGVYLFSLQIRGCNIMFPKLPNVSLPTYWDGYLIVHPLSVKSRTDYVSGLSPLCYLP